MPVIDRRLTFHLLDTAHRIAKEAIGRPTRLFASVLYWKRAPLLNHKAPMNQKKSLLESASTWISLLKHYKKKKLSQRMVSRL